MKILLIHNKYQFPGGEDSVFESEKNLLENHNHIVRTLFFDNKDIDSLAKTIKLVYQLIFNKKSKKKVEDIIKEFKPQIIHVHNFFYVASPSIFFAASKNKIPIVVTLHNYRLICSGSLLMRDAQPCELCVNKIFPIEGVKYKCHRESKIATIQLTLTTGIHKIMKTWNNKVSLYVALTEFARNKFLNSSLNLLPEKIVVKPNSVNNFECSNFHERENIFLFVGRLSIEKGIEVVLKAFENKNTILEIIGDGPMKNTVESICNNNANIKYLGYRDQAFIISKLKKCQALIVPSICFENLPTAILEAYSTGTPVIISDISNLNELVTNKFNGLHFRTNDSIDLYRVIKDLMENILQYQPLYLNARNTYLEKYTPEINYKRLIGIYEKAISNSL